MLGKETDGPYVQPIGVAEARPDRRKAHALAFLVHGSVDVVPKTGHF